MTRKAYYVPRYVCMHVTHYLYTALEARYWWELHVRGLRVSHHVMSYCPSKSGLSVCLSCRRIYIA